MKKNKLVLANIILLALILVCTSVYATVNTTISLKADKTSLKRGDTVTVTLSLSGVEASKKVTSVEGYVNYDQNVFEKINYDSVVKGSDNKLTIGSESLPVEDVTNGANTGSTAFVGINFDPASDNDTRFVIDFNEGVASDTDLISVKFKVKSNASLGDVANAIEYKAFVITTGTESSSEKSAEITKTLGVKVVANSNPDEPGPGGDDPQPTVTLSSIAITTAPDKTTYKAGETFDKAGMVVTATYSDGSKKAVTGYSYSPTAALKTSDTEVEVTYTEGGVTKKATQKITVNKAEEPATKTLKSISITKSPNKTTYTEGESFDKTGMVVTAKYTDGSEKTVTNYTCSPTTALKTNNTEITVTYTEDGVTKTTTQNIKVNAASAKGLNNTNTNTNKNTNTNTNTNKNTVDTTTKTGALPATGAKIVIIPVLVLVALAYVSYVKYQKYKGI